MKPPNLARWLSSGRFIDYKGWGIFTRASQPRKSEAILLIHGFPTSSFDFLRIWQILSKKYQLLTADMLGFGFCYAKHSGKLFFVVVVGDFVVKFNKIFENYFLFRLSFIGVPCSSNR
jgi:hypothetical protein